MESESSETTTTAAVAAASNANGRSVDRHECFLCHGRGHWARNCTSLPSIYLVDNPPKCYCCGGIGHFARFCPSSDVSKERFSERRHCFSNPENWVQPQWPKVPFFYYYPPSLFSSEPSMPAMITSHLSDYEPALVSSYFSEPISFSFSSSSSPSSSSSSSSSSSPTSSKDEKPGTFVNIDYTVSSEKAANLG